eukprot:10342625-Alexandrium_andersonii.AAC.1
MCTAPLVPLPSRMITIPLDSACRCLSTYSGKQMPVDRWDSLTGRDAETACRSHPSIKVARPPCAFRIHNTLLGRAW